MLNYLQTSEPNENQFMSMIAFAIILGAVFLSYKLIKSMAKRAGQDD